MLWPEEPFDKLTFNANTISWWPTCVALLRLRPWRSEVHLMVQSALLSMVSQPMVNEYHEVILMGVWSSWCWMVDLNKSTFFSDINLTCICWHSSRIRSDCIHATLSNIMLKQMKYSSLCKFIVYEPFFIGTEESWIKCCTFVSSENDSVIYDVIWNVNGKKWNILLIVF